ncbi:glucosamine-6-phosphate deaminase [Mesomycoplasma neurolyticum]|uniref:Glucosamine-6-phosphate isomerase n=1 Tax=Mesomycoplasma neurolyticum TaxID=2120 RepID=A0A449A6E5_9BACT|nr:glucosamine-6-phosphate deaminase [Mesomycoplasma neurolyticum]VEU59831.1 Glucosamine-6-phosphate isomerase [Mesomycoplasma neurolyticum]
MKIIIFSKVNDLQKYVANLFIEQIKQNPNSVLGFATGVSPVAAYQLLIEDHKKNKTSWKNITTFNLDEFVGLNPEHPEAFIKQMKNNLFDHIDVQKENIFIPNGNAKNLNQEALNYEELIANKLIDFQYISLGVNGHMAYNEPGTNPNKGTHVANLTKETINDLVVKNKFDSYEKSPKEAITMGIQTILKYTKKIIMVSFGENKALVTKKMLEEKPNNDVTASYLQFHPNCTFILDEKASKFLSQETLNKAERR